jgi:hypothetical protein
MKRVFLCAAAIFTLGNLAMIQNTFASPDFTVKPDKHIIITLPDNALPVEKTAAEELARYISLATCAKTEIIPEGKLERKDSADAYIGQCRFTKEQGFYIKKFKQEEFNIVVKDGRLFIYGDDAKGDPFRQDVRTGTLFGVYDFLENELGITWIWPGKTGEDVPKLKELHLTPFSRTDSPRLVYRGVKFSSAYKESKEFNTDLNYWFKRMKLSWIPKAWTGHSWGNYITKTGMNKQHPEWLALWGGERRGPHCCTSNKEFRDYVVEQCLNNPINKDKWIVSISPNDGYGFCECEKCRALDVPGTDYDCANPDLSNRHWDYANYIAKEVKKRNPELNVAMLAYTSYTNPPTNIDKFEDNLFVSLCFSAAYCVRPEKKKEFQENILKWKSLGVKLVDYEYWGMHYWLDLPYIFTSQIKGFMPFMYKNGLLGMHGEAQKNFATQGPNYYLACHLMWNPESDSDKILNRYYKAFGPAAKYIMDYYSTFETSIQENQKCDFAYLALINSWPEIFPEKTISKAGECLQKAKEAVKGNPTCEERVRLVEIGYLYTKTMLELLGIYRKLGRAGVPLWYFGYQGALAEFKYWKTLPEMPKAWLEFWKKHPDEPLGKEEKLKLLKRALYLGNERERIITEFADLPIVSLGMFNYFKAKGLNQWHQTVKEELEKEGVKAEQ